MFIPEEEEVHRDAEPDVHVDRDGGTGPRVVIHQDHLTIMTIINDDDNDASDNDDDNDDGDDDDDDADDDDDGDDDGGVGDGDGGGGGGGCGIMGCSAAFVGR